MKKEYSRTLKFDFPAIPILGSLLLLLILLNDKSLCWFLFDQNGVPIVSLLTTTLLFLGTAGLTISQLISFSCFDQFFELRHLLLKSKSNKFSDTTYEWFEILSKNLTPRIRKTSRGVHHKLGDRRALKDLSQGQIHATLHALEVSCRAKHPEIASQIEGTSKNSLSL